MTATGAYLKGRTALVTGSTSGIGLAVARALACAGARVAIHGPDGADASEALAAVSVSDGPVNAFCADLRERSQVARLMMAVTEWSGGGPDILVNSAGMQSTTGFAAITDTTWDDILAVNLTGAMLTMRHALPRMAARGFGRVINIASVHGLVASAEKGPYVASKFGLIGLSRVAALEYASAGTRESGGVTVNCICPGWTETALIEPQITARAAMHGGDRVAGIAGLLGDKQPSRRMSSPDEIGFLALWLASPLAHNITGAALPVDGGWTAQ